MSLPVGERWKLRVIERAEARTDPSLAARFRIFNRLSRYEYMPRTERLRARAIRRKKRAERVVPGYLMSKPETLLRAGVPALDGGEQRRIGADQRGTLQREERAVGSAARSNPLIGQIHGLRPVQGCRPDRCLGLAE